MAYIKREDAISAIEELPIVVPEVEYAAWVRPAWYCEPDDSRLVQCSSCKTVFWEYFKRFSFCPVCGKHMRNYANK